MSASSPPFDKENSAMLNPSRMNLCSSCFVVLAVACITSSAFSREPERGTLGRDSQGATLGVNIVGDDRGITITRVHENKPAQQMDLRSGDRITLINGRPVRSADDFISAIRNMNPDDEVELDVVRGNSEFAVRGQLEPYDQSVARNVSEQSNDSDAFRDYQDVVKRNRSKAGEQLSTEEFLRDSQRSAERAVDDKRFNSASRQTSFEDSEESNPARTGGVEDRLARVEEQLDRITQELEELRNQIGTGPLSASRDTRGPEFRPRPQAQARPNEIPINSGQQRMNDRWNTENRFEQADLAGARERANLEAARRRANATGARLQQESARDLRRNAPTNRNQVPPEPTAEEPR
jgi:hypothetical protein